MHAYRLLRLNLGIDYLDFNFRLEKMHGLLVADSAIADLTQRSEEAVSYWLKLKSRDIRVGPFYEVIRNHCLARCAQCVAPRGLSRPVLTVNINPPQYLCQKCGKALSPYPLTWEQFRETLAQTIGTQEAEIEPQKWLHRDLGFC